MDRKYIVYIHENKTNHKVYVGITSKRPTDRWVNGNGYKSNKHFYASIQKYGWDGFEHIIYARNISKESAQHIEMDLIELYQSDNPEHGYNQTKGGELELRSEAVKERLKGRFVSEETRKKLSKSNSGKHRSEETRKKISESN